MSRESPVKILCFRHPIGLAARKAQRMSLLMLLVR
jgi:hypothetical protein